MIQELRLNAGDEQFDLVGQFVEIDSNGLKDWNAYFHVMGTAAIKVSGAVFNAGSEVTITTADGRTGPGIARTNSLSTGRDTICNLHITCAGPLTNP